MTQADDIREFVNENYFRPARKKNQNIVEVRAGDVSRLMELMNNIPAVCGAIGANKMEAKYNVRKTDEIGPQNGANKYFRFQLS